MKYADKLHNTLTHSNLLPPPVTSGRKFDNTFRLNYVTLLHQAYAFCGRVSIFLLLMLPFVCVSCEKPDLGFEDDETRSGTEQNDSTGNLNISITVEDDWEGEKTFTF